MLEPKIVCGCTGSGWLIGFNLVALVIGVPANTQIPEFIAGVAGTGKETPIYLAQQIGQFSDVGNVRCGCDHRVPSTGIHIGTDGFLCRHTTASFSGWMPAWITRFVSLLMVELGA